MFATLDFSSSQVSNITLTEKLDYLCNCKSEISNVCNVVDSHCLQAMKIVRHHASGCFDWLISERWSVYPWREALSILSGEIRKIYVCPSCVNIEEHILEQPCCFS